MSDRTIKVEAGEEQWVRNTRAGTRGRWHLVKEYEAWSYLWKETDEREAHESTGLMVKVECHNAIPMGRASIYHGDPADEYYPAMKCPTCERKQVRRGRRGGS